MKLYIQTGDKETRQPIKEVVLTKAEKVSSLNVTEIGTGDFLYWILKFKKPWN